MSRGRDNTLDSAALRRRAFRLEYLTICWDVVEGAIAVTAGIVAGSIALVGFGIDSSIEVFAASVVIWQLRAPASDSRRTLALRLISVTFFALAAYVGVESVRDLIGRDEPDASSVGIVLNAVALPVMAVVARLKRTTGEALGNDVLIADAGETRLSNYLSLTVLAGLALNAALDWWWADPAAALVVAGFAACSGFKAWRETD